MSKIKLGECPFCKSKNYIRDTPILEDDFCRVECNCEDCGNDFVEYFGLDEVYFTKDDKDETYTNNVWNIDKDTIGDWAEAEIENAEVSSFTNTDHYKDYIKRCKRIFKLMREGVVKEE